MGPRTGTSEGEASMNYSIYSVDRVTHLKIVVIALAAAIAMVSISLASHISPDSDRVAVVRTGKHMPG